MVQIDKPPDKELLFKNLSKKHKDTINKMLDLQDILLNDPPNDKRFKKNEFNYFMEYFNIIGIIQYSDYNDRDIQETINKLYNEVFKHRRY